MIAPIKPTGSLNVLGTPLLPCCLENSTGWYRNGSCETDSGDHGRHVICAIMTEEFLAFSKQMGNDLSTPIPEYNFPGLKPGECWCLCAGRWQEAFEAGIAPKVKFSNFHFLIHQLWEFEEGQDVSCIHQEFPE